jgi:hypothetical protein
MIFGLFMIIVLAGMIVVVALLVRWSGWRWRGVDADELERPNEPSLTSVIGDAPHPLQPSHDESGSVTPAAGETPSLGDTTINELLREPTAPGDPSREREQSDYGVPGHVEPPDELIAPELLFPKRSSEE